MVRKLIIIFVSINAVAVIVYSGLAQVKTDQGREAKKDDTLPSAIVSKTGQGNSCVKCHENLRDPRLNRPVWDWISNVHNTRGNNCNLCHGGNPDMMDAESAKSKLYHFVGKPDKKILTNFCGRGGCHVEELSDFKRGPHYQEVLKTNKPNCTHCHGVHNIQRSSSRIIDGELCAECHQADHAKRVVSVMSSIEHGLHAVEVNIKFLRQKHANVDNITSRLVRTRRLFNQMVHVSSKEEMLSTKTIIDLEIKNLDVESKSLSALLKRLDLLHWFMVIIGAGIIISYTIYAITMYSKRRKEP